MLISDKKGGEKMSKLLLVLVSFIVGAVISAAVIEFSKNNSNIGEQSLIESEAIAESRGIVIEGAEPVVPPIGVEVKDSSFEKLIQPLDGMNCTNCSFKDIVLEYSGGSFKLVNASFSGSLKVNFKGAAANTFILEKYLELISKPKVPLHPKPSQKPKFIKIKEPINMDLISFEEK
jgi:hypothetical protein